MVGVVQEFGWRAVNILYVDSTWGQGWATGVRECAFSFCPCLFQEYQCVSLLLRHSTVFLFPGPSLSSLLPFLLSSPRSSAPATLSFYDVRTRLAPLPPPSFPSSGYETADVMAFGYLCVYIGLHGCKGVYRCVSLSKFVPRLWTLCPCLSMSRCKHS